MPQLDLIPYFSQIFWLSLFFFIFYFFIFIFVIPFFAFQFKTRFKKLKIQQHLVKNYGFREDLYQSLFFSKFSKFFDLFFSKNSSYSSVAFKNTGGFSDLVKSEKFFYKYFTLYLKVNLFTF